MTGQPARQLGGLLDYALFPLTYMKKALGAGSYTLQIFQMLISLLGLTISVIVLMPLSIMEAKTLHSL